MTVSGAYGRDYTSKAKIQKDWDEGKDFTIRDAFSGGGYINKEDAVRFGVTSITVRYGEDRKQYVLKVQ